MTHTKPNIDICAELLQHILERQIYTQLSAVYDDDELQKLSIVHCTLSIVVAGRFMQEDTYHGDGMNRSAYCGNDPVNYKDPSGHNRAPAGWSEYQWFLHSFLIMRVTEEMGVGGKNIPDSVILQYINANGAMAHKELDMFWSFYRHYGYDNSGQPSWEANVKARNGTPNYMTGGGGSSSGGSSGLSSGGGSGTKSGGSSGNNDTISTSKSLAIDTVTIIRDVTNEVNKALGAAVREVHKVREAFGAFGIRMRAAGDVTFSLTFYSLVNHGGIWDIKLKEAWEGDSERKGTIGTVFPGKDTQVMYRGMLMTPEDIGNYTYGYLGGAFGFTAGMLIAGSYYAAGFPQGGAALRNETGDWNYVMLGYQDYYIQNLLWVYKYG